MLCIHTFATKGRFKRCHLSIIKSSIILAEHKEIKSSGSGRSLSDQAGQHDITHQPALDRVLRLAKRFLQILEEGLRGLDLRLQHCYLSTKMTQHVYRSAYDMVWSVHYEATLCQPGFTHSEQCCPPVCVCGWSVCPALSPAPPSPPPADSPRPAALTPAQHNTVHTHYTWLE